MRCSLVPCRIVCTSLLLCLALAGCGTSYPYYTVGGSPESRVIIIHLDENTTEKISAGTGIGGGLTRAMQMQATAAGEVTIEKDSAKVTMIAKGPVFLVKNVEYDGKQIDFHEPIL